MSTRAHDCLKKGNNTVCPACGRIAPDWCAEDDPTPPNPLVAEPVGEDLSEALIDVPEEEVIEATQAEPAEQAEVAVKIFEGKRGRKAL